MKNLKKLLAIGMATIMTLSLGACGKSGDNDKSKHNGGKEVEISYWNSGQGTDFMDAMIKAFNEKQSDYYVFYNATASSSTVTSTYLLDDVNTIDLYMSNTIYDTSKMATLDDVLDSTADGDSVPLKEKFNASYLDYERAEDGHFYSLTWGGGTIGIVYNKKLFDKAGIEVTPRTTDELAAVCDKLLSAGVTPLTHYMGEDGESYWLYLEDLWQAQYDGMDYFQNTFYACKDAAGNSPSKDVLTAKDGRYQVLKAMEKFITPEYVLPGSNSQDHITMQTLFLNQDIGMMANGSWLSNEMKDTGSIENYGVMKTPVISTITDKLTTVKGDTALRKLISAIDAVTDGTEDISKYQSGDGYMVDGNAVSAADWEYVANARNAAAITYPAQTCFIPDYADAVDGAKEFLKFFFSDEGYKIFSDNLHMALPLNSSDGTVDTADWNGFEKEMQSLLNNASSVVSRYSRRMNSIFIDGGAKPYADYNFISLFCSNNASDRATADEAWEEIVKKIDGNYSNWLANIK